MVKNTFIAILICGLCITRACAASSIPEHILEAYQLGIQGNAQENKTAINALKEINENAPDPFALAMLGSAEVTQAKYTQKPWQKMQLSEKGIAKLVSAVERSEALPYALQARIKIIAGCTFASVPAMLNRTEHGRYLLNKVIEQGDSFSNLDSKLQASAYRCAAIAAEKLLDEESSKQLTHLAEQVPPSHVQQEEE